MGDMHRRFLLFGQQGREPKALLGCLIRAVTRWSESALKLLCLVLCSPGDLPAARDRHCGLGHELQLVHHHAACAGAGPL